MGSPARRGAAKRAAQLITPRGEETDGSALDAAGPRVSISQRDRTNVLIRQVY